MATRLKKFSRSKAVKTLLVVLFIGCFAAAGVIAGYLPAYGYMDGNIYIADALMADNYYESDCFADRVNSDYNKIMNIVNHNARNNTMHLTGNDLRDLNCYADVRYRGYDFTNGYNADIIFTVDKSDITRVGGAVPSAVTRRGFYRYGDLVDEEEHITFGYTQEQFDEQQAWWLETRRNMQVILISEIALLAVGIVLLCMICSVSGEDSEGNATFPKFLRLPYEISLLGVICTAVLFGFILFNDAGLSNLCNSLNGRTLMMTVSGVVSALVAAFLLYHAVSIAVRIKNGKAYRGSVMLLVLYYVLKALKWCGRLLLKLLKQAARFPLYIKEIFTGELYKAGTVARKLIWLDGVFIIASVLVFLLILFAENAVPLLLEAVFLGLFLFGRHLVIRDGAQLERQIREMYVGNYSYKPDMSKNSPYTASSDMLSAISDQYRRGLEETVKAERTKMELVTNVSHDLKTPLTSIIGYIELLSKEELTGDAAEYVGILQKKSERLKNIVSDVFELAKTTSGEITVERTPLDLTKLSYQTLGEMEDKIAASGLEIKMNICEPPVTVISDGKRLYRVIQNLLDNALKYSMQGTRIYYSLEKHGNYAYIIIKNVASYEMNFTKEEIMERFTRGDKARSTEGTGLGLSIAQGFTLACGGNFDIELDGDMFKAIVSFPMAAEPAETVQAVTADE